MKYAMRMGVTRERFNFLTFGYEHGNKGFYEHFKYDDLRIFKGYKHTLTNGHIVLTYPPNDFEELFEEVE